MYNRMKVNNLKKVVIIISNTLFHVISIENRKTYEKEKQQNKEKYKNRGKNIKT